MKKALFAAFTGLCVVSSIMATSAKPGKVKSNTRIDQIVRDTIPSKKSDTSTHPKRDTASMPRLTPDQK